MPARIAVTRKPPVLLDRDGLRVGDTLTELRQAFAQAEAECEGGVSPRVAPFADLRDVGSLLQRAGFALSVTDVDRIVVRYDNAFALMADLRRMGATNVMIERRRTPTRRATLLRMAQVYTSRFADADGRIRDLAVRLGDAQKPAKAAAAGLGEGKSRGGGEGEDEVGRVVSDPHLRRSRVEPRRMSKFRAQQRFGESGRGKLTRRPRPA
jgi:hypothetical protein